MFYKSEEGRTEEEANMPEEAARVVLSDYEEGEAPQIAVKSEEPRSSETVKKDW
jgi:hypothetical protein